MPNVTCRECGDAPASYFKSPSSHVSIKGGYCSLCYERLCSLDSDKKFRSKLDEWGLDEWGHGPGR